MNNSKKLQEDIPNQVRDVLGILVDVLLHSHEGKDYLELRVPQCSYPISFHGEYYYRSGATNQQLRGAALTAFLLEKTGTHWDDIPVDGVSPDDLDYESFAIFRREAVRNGRMTREDIETNNGDLLDRLKLTTGNKLKRAAILLFHRDSERWFAGAYIKIGRFGKGSELRYQDEIHGSLFLQADKVIDLIYTKYLIADISYDKDTRIETYPFPREAVREALYNSIMHCAYGELVPIQVRIEDSAMYISNDIAFNHEWTPETLMRRHRSKPYNPNIANAFFRAGYVEAWGRGIEKMCEACADYGCKTPEYTLVPGGIMLTLYARETGQKNRADGVNDGANDGVNDGVRLTKTERKILRAVAGDIYITYTQLTEKLSISEATVTRAFRKMKKCGILVRQGTDKSGFWELTPAGKRLL